MGKDEESWKKKAKQDDSPSKESPLDLLVDQMDELNETDTSSFNPDQIMEH